MNKILLILKLFIPILCLFTLSGQGMIGSDPCACSSNVAAPVVHNTTFQLSVPVVSNFNVGQPQVDNGPTSCTVIGGDVTDFTVDAGCIITVTAAGKVNLTTISTKSITVQASNTGGTASGTMTINTWPDGATAAACTTPQYPTALNTLATQPQWAVAGVDYCVGPASTTTFKNPAVDTLPTGTTLSGSTVLVSTAGTVIDSWDFTTGTSGYTLDINAANVTVTNNKFKTNGLAQALRLENTATTLTFKYNDMDGNGSTTTGALFSAPCTATNYTLQYNWLHNAPRDVVNFCSGTVTAQFNVLKDANFAGGNPSSLLAEIGTSNLTSNATFNFGYQLAIATIGGLQFSAGPHYTGASTRNNNTVVVSGSGVVLNNGVGLAASSGFTSGGTLVAQNNFGAYRSSATGTFLHCDTAPFVTYTNNLNMVDGSTFSAIACPPPGNVPTVTASSFAIPSPVALNDIVGQIDTHTGTDATAFTQTACTGCTGWFSVASDTGVISVTSAGVTAINGSTDKQTINGPTVIASNGSGSSTQVVESVVAYADGSKNAPSCAGTFSATGVSVANIGRRYFNNEILTVQGGTLSPGGPQTTLTITTNTNGQVLAAVVTNPGSYSTPPTNPVTTTASFGVGAQFNLAYAANVGGPQQASLLDSYTAHRPPWQVAGVDYCVGPPAGTVFRDPATMTTVQCGGSCVVDAGLHTIALNDSNITLDGWDFGLGGGWSLILSNRMSNVVIKNSRFAMGANANPLTQNPFLGGTNGSNLTFLNDSFDGTNAPAPRFTNPGLVNWQGNNLTVRYSWLHNGLSDGVASGAGTTTMRYNLVESINIPGDAGAHPDIWQATGTGTATLDAAFTTLSEQIPGGPPIGPQGFPLANDAYTGNSKIDYNTWVCAGDASSNPQGIQCAYMTGQQSSFSGGTAEVLENYVDLTKSFGMVYPGDGTQATGFTYARNIDMTTGGPCNFSTGSGAVPCAGAAVVSPPVLTATTLNPGTPVINVGDAAGSPTLSGGTPTACVILSGDPAADFAINATTCALTFTTQGKTDWNGASAKKTATLSMRASNTAGTSTANVTVNGWADGSSQAPVGGVTPQPTLFSASYSRRPTWKMPGVDYAVGIPAAVTLATPTQVALNAAVGVGNTTLTGRSLTINANNITLDGWDFSAATGISINLTGRSNITIKNSKFAYSAPNTASDMPIYGNGWSNLTVTNCEIDGTNVDTTGRTALLSSQDAPGGLTFRYNYIHDSAQDMFSLGPGTIDMRYNYIKNAGPDGHADFNQNTGTGTATYTIMFNTAIQTIASPGQGFMYSNNLSYGTGEIGYNAFISPGPSAGVNAWMGLQAPATMVSGATYLVDNNYADIRGTQIGLVYTPISPVWAFSNNINLVTGAALP